MDSLHCETIFRTLGTAVVVCDASGRIVQANPAAESMLGRRSEELAGHWFTEVIRSSALGSLHPLAASGFEPEGNAGTRIARISRPDGAVVLLECRNAPFLAGSGARWCLWELRELPDTHRGGEPEARKYLRVPAKTVERLGPHPGLQMVLRTGVEVLAEDFNARCAHFWLIDPASGRPVLRAISDSQGVRIDAAGPGLPEEDPCPGMAEVVHSWAPFLSSQPGVHPGLDPDWVASEGLVALISHPLQLGGEQYGALSAGLDSPPSPEMSEALEGFAAILSAALKNVELLRRREAARIDAESQRRRFQAVVSLMPVAVAVAEGPEARLTLLNPAGRMLWGLPAPPETVRELHEHAPLRSRSGAPYELNQQPLLRALLLGDRVRETVRYAHPDGRDRVLEVQASPFPGPRAAAIATYHDITDRVELQSALEERAAQLKALLDHLPVGVAYFDSEHHCRACNGPACTILGRSRSQMIGAPASEILASAPGLLEAIRRCVVEQTPYSESASPWADPARIADVRHLDWQFQPLPPAYNGQPQGALALIVDASNRKRADDALRAAKEEAELSARNKTRFLSAISHDLRTPVNALNLLSRMVSDLAGPDRPHEMNRAASELRRASANLVELVNDLLDLTRFDSGESAQHIADFPIAEWLDALLSPLALEARERGLDFRWSVEPHRCRVRADRVKLGRVLTNLVGNALKFTNSGCVEIQIDQPAPRALRLRVRDTGPGIPADKIEQIFDEFAQLRNPERDRTKGTGLGLAICRRLVEAVGGSVSVHSEPGIGSTFTAVYPVAAPEEAAHDEPPLGPGPFPEPPLADSITPILLVEDDEATRYTMSYLLEQFGYEVVAVQDGLEAMDYLSVHRPGLVLLDLMMPGIDGTEVLRRIRARLLPEELPVVILSGDVPAERARQLEIMGANATVTKPVDPDDLVATISRFVRATTPSPGFDSPIRSG